MTQPQTVWGICFLLSLILCPLFPGVINRTKAFFAGRHGPRYLQVYYDIFKLLRKASVYSRTTTDVLRLAPMALLGALLTAALLFTKSLFFPRRAALPGGDGVVGFFIILFVQSAAVTPPSACNCTHRRAAAACSASSPASLCRV